MKKSLIFDRLGQCGGCQHEKPGPSQLINPMSPCTWCERNPFLVSEIKDQYLKQEPVQAQLPRNLEIDMSGLPEDHNPAKKANEQYLQDWGLKPGGLDKPKKGEKKK